MVNFATTTLTEALTANLNVRTAMNSRSFMKKAACIVLIAAGVLAVNFLRRCFLLRSNNKNKKEKDAVSVGKILNNILGNNHESQHDLSTCPCCEEFSLHHEDNLEFCSNCGYYVFF